MNKIRRFAAFALVLALMLLTVFVPAVHAEETEARTTEYVHLRSGPGTKYKILSKYRNGTELVLLEKTNGSWYRIDDESSPYYDTIEGYRKVQYNHLFDKQNRLDDLYLLGGAALS